LQIAVFQIKVLWFGIIYIKRSTSCIIPSQNKLVIFLKSLSLLESTQLIVLSLNRQLQPPYSLLVLCVVSAYSLQAVKEDALLRVLDTQNKFSMFLRKIGTCVPNIRIRASGNRIFSTTAVKT
jgi:hypothetical protein